MLVFVKQLAVQCCLYQIKKSVEVHVHVHVGTIPKDAQETDRPGLPLGRRIKGSSEDKALHFYSPSPLRSELDVCLFMVVIQTERDFTSGPRKDVPKPWSLEIMRNSLCPLSYVDIHPREGIRSRSKANYPNNPAVCLTSMVKAEL